MFKLISNEEGLKAQVGVPGLKKRTGKKGWLFGMIPGMGGAATEAALAHPPSLLVDVEVYAGGMFSFREKGSNVEEAQRVLTLALATKASQMKTSRVRIADTQADAEYSPKGSFVQKKMEEKRVAAPLVEVAAAPIVVSSTTMDDDSKPFHTTAPYTVVIRGRTGSTRSEHKTLADARYEAMAALAVTARRVSILRPGMRAEHHYDSKALCVMLEMETQQAMRLGEARAKKEREEKEAKSREDQRNNPKREYRRRADDRDEFAEGRW